MGAVVFLSTVDVLELHTDLIASYGGIDGVRDQGLLESAVNAPKASYGGQSMYADVIEMAAALMFSLIKNHAFLDGNKRIGTAAALTFLKLNGLDVRQDIDGLVELALGVATGLKDRSGIAAYLRASIA